MPILHLDSIAQCVHALQSKPFIVENGAVAVGKRDPDYFNRAAIGIDRRGNILVAGAFSPTGRGATQLEFASWLVEVTQGKDTSAQVVLSLDGGPGAQIVIPRINAHFGSKGATYVPAIVVFGEKRQ